VSELTPIDPPALPEEAVERATVPAAELRYFRAGAGRPVVLLHTLRTQLDYFHRLIERLDTTQSVVIAVDLPGHGRSSAPLVDYTADFFADAIEQLLESCKLSQAILVGDSIGGTIALVIAARGNRRVSHVIAVNPYDYGRWGGIRRSSALANVLFTAMLWPGIGEIVARTGTRGVLRRVMEGGLYDPRLLPLSLIDEMHRCGSLPGHARAFRSLNRQWRSWIAARSGYPAIEIPVTLAYGSDDWSRPAEREANAHVIPGTRTIALERCGHFASLEKPDAISQLIHEAL
jgi:pimeloyl-ACP methyl ester carboxylesterase